LSNTTEELERLKSAYVDLVDRADELDMCLRLTEDVMDDSNKEELLELLATVMKATRRVNQDLRDTSSTLYRIGVARGEARRRDERGALPSTNYQVTEGEA
jgi:hypothetical protein|tara:strand:+ start:94 stop:396 length:303 start_codon:yes stop_codon:yes gene_type:complete